MATATPSKSSRTGDRVHMIPTRRLAGWLMLAFAGVGGLFVYAVREISLDRDAVSSDQFAIGVVWLTVLPLAGLIALALFTFWLIGRIAAWREEAMSACLRSEQRLESLLNHSGEAMYVKRSDGRYQWVNAGFESLCRVSSHDILGRSDAELFPSDIASILDGNRLKALKSDAPIQCEIDVVRDDGQRTFRVIEFPLRLDGNMSAAFGGVVTDITERHRLQKKLADSEAQLQTLIDLLPEMIFARDQEGRFVLANRSVAEAYGVTVQELLGRNQREVEMDAEEVHRMLVDDLEVIESDRSPVVAEESFTDHEGRRRTLRTTKLVCALPGTDEPAVLVVAADITERRRVDEALFEARERVQITLQAISDAVITTDAEGIIDYLNPSAVELTGWAVKAARSQALKTVFRVVDENSRQPLPDLADRCLQKGARIDFEDGVLIDRSGIEHAIEQSAASIRDRDHGVLGLVVVFRDVTEARRRVRAIAHQATHDTLTGLVNRREFGQRLQRALDNAREKGALHALCYLDLDQFKVVNDIAGHAAGDELLKQVAALLLHGVRARDTLARLGGDEFGLLLENCPLNKAIEIADSLVTTLQDFRFIWEGHTFKIGVSIGLVSITAETESVSQLLTQADLSCYNAKDLGRNRVCVYRLEDKQAARLHSGILRAAGLLEALEKDRFRLFCQPVAPLAEEVEQPLFYELLLRLQTGRGELLLPGAFLPVAERHNLMAAIDRWVIRTALQRRTDLFGANQAGPGFSINLSRSALNDDALPEFIHRQFAETGVPPQCICFEISETVATSNPTQINGFIAAFKPIGCRFVIDDFGSGSTSFDYIKNLPIDYLKIGGRFVRAMLHDPIDHAMVLTIKQVAHIKGVRTIAECVESQEIAERLRQLGVDYGQGFALGLPQPLESLEPASAAGGESIRIT